MDTSNESEIELLRIRLDLTKKNMDMLSHDIGLPLTVMKGMVEQMLRGESGELNQEQTENLVSILKNIKRIDDIRKETLMLTKLESSGSSAKSLTNLYSLMERVMYRMLPMTDAKGQTIHLESPHFSAMVTESLMEQVLENLLINASNYTPRGGTITITAEKEGDVMNIRIKDTGIGIPSEMREKIFEPYIRLSKELADGTGLGLAIVRTIVSNHGGRIWVERPEDGGSEFVIELPLKD